MAVTSETELVATVAISDKARPGFRTVTFEQVLTEYKRQARSLVEGGVDLLGWIMAPLRHVAMHVVEPEGVRGLLPDGIRLGQVERSQDLQSVEVLCHSAPQTSVGKRP